MNKTIKKVLIGAASVLAAAGLAFGILNVVKVLKRKPVKVYSVSELTY